MVSFRDTEAHLKVVRAILILRADSLTKNYGGFTIDRLEYEELFDTLPVSDFMELVSLAAASFGSAVLFDIRILSHPTTLAVSWQPRDGWKKS